ncbi:metacaspase-1-like [Acanthaster planci]|uniref:Metacaspase-1-like n=1 Tax=Acanthaster planci TaxID=133434 RepID=A0A8B7XY25_ACAPL|nr:metacaspase-1-like [Acanthaster planci]
MNWQGSPPQAGQNYKYPQGYDAPGGQNYVNRQGSRSQVGENYKNPQGNDLSGGGSYLNGQGSPPQAGVNYRNPQNPQGNTPGGGGSYLNGQGSPLQAGGNYNNPQTPRGNAPEGGGNYMNWQESPPQAGQNYKYPQGYDAPGGENYVNRQGSHSQVGENYKNPQGNDLSGGGSYLNGQGSRSQAGENYKNPQGYASEGGENYGERKALPGEESHLQGNIPSDGKNFGQGISQEGSQTNGQGALQQDDKEYDRDQEEINQPETDGAEQSLPPNEPKVDGTDYYGSETSNELYHNQIGDLDDNLYNKDGENFENLEPVQSGEQKKEQQERGGLKGDDKDTVKAEQPSNHLSLDEETSSSHFMAYSLSAIILIMATYILYHNKQRIIAIIIEGRNGNGRRKRTKDGYQKLDQNLSEAMPSLNQQATKDYKY